MQKSQTETAEFRFTPVTQAHLKILWDLHRLMDLIRTSEDRAVFESLQKAEREIEELILKRIGEGAWIEPGQFVLVKTDRAVFRGSYPDDKWHGQGTRLEVQYRGEEVHD